MNPALTVAAQILEFLWTNRDKVKDVVLSIEKLSEGALGSEKAAAFKGYIAAALNLDSQIESAWPIVQPIFNLAVKGFKKPAAPAAPAAA